jgi:glycosyltransferase involved in cell wall biosynthesis
MLAGTIVARNYLAQAQVLATSFLEHHPESEFVTLVIDGTADDRASVHVPGPVVLPEDLGLASGEWEQMAGIYSLIEFATALKPAFLRHLLASRVDGGVNAAVCYLDPDIEVYRPFSEVAELAEQAGIVLTPHVLHPLPRDGCMPDERMLMLAGLFNLGFICVGRRALPFLDWWHERLRLDGVVDLPNALFTDQRWVDWVPSLFGCHVMDDHGLNVAYWNAHERPLARTEDATMSAAGVPLKFFHFSGYDIDEPWRLSKHAGDHPRCTLGDSPLLADLCNAYAATLEAAGHREQRKQAYRLGTTATGLVLTPLVRAAYRMALVAARSNGAPLPPCPFGADGGVAFEEWLTAPVMGAPEFGISRWHVELWRTRPDLTIAFPDLGGPDAARYRQWLDDDSTAQQRQREIRGSLRPPSSDDARSNAARPAGGWNVVGYFSAEFGIGEAARRMGVALRAGGLATEFVSVSAPTSRGQHRLRHEVQRALHFRDSLYCVNADQFERVVATAEGRSARNGRRIGLWFWEVDQFPAEWQGAFAHLDEVWCSSLFTTDVIAAASPVPVHTVPLPVWAPSAPTPFRRQHLGLPSDRFVFLFVYDFNSVMARKNPLDLVDAYTRAFGPHDGASLVLKSINGSTRPVELDRLQQAVAGRPDIVVNDGYLDAHRLQALIELSDCFVSLHRCEGFGLNLAAAMAAGKPVIATGYSGNLTFMDATSAFLVPFELVPVGAGHEPYPADAHWAQPDLDAAAGLLRLVFDQPDVRQSIATRGRDLVLDRLAPERVGAQVADRLLDAMLCAP